MRKLLDNIPRGGWREAQLYDLSIPNEPPAVLSSPVLLKFRLWNRSISIDRIQLRWDDVSLQLDQNWLESVYVRRWYFWIFSSVFWKSSSKRAQNRVPATACVKANPTFGHLFFETWKSKNFKCSKPPAVNRAFFSCHRPKKLSRKSDYFPDGRTNRTNRTDNRVQKHTPTERALRAKMFMMITVIAHLSGSPKVSQKTPDSSVSEKFPAIGHNLSLTHLSEQWL